MKTNHITKFRRTRFVGIRLLFAGLAVLFAAETAEAQPRRAAPQRTGLPLPSRGGAPVPTPSALPSQQLASQAPKNDTGKQRQSCVLRSSRKVGTTDIIEIGLEGSGKVIQTLLGDEKESPSDKMELVAGFRYEERVLEWNASPETPHLKTVRQYSQAGMKRSFQGTITRPLLDISRKNIVADFDGKSVTLFSPGGSLKNDQYLLISDLPLNSILLDYFLPNKEVKLGEEWTVPNSVLAPLLGLESYEVNTVRLVLTAIVDDMAEVDLYLSGNQKDAKGNPVPSTIQGASLGASVSMDLQGKYQFDLKANRMTWFGITISEKRSESLAEPGLDWKGTIRIRIAPLEKPDALTDSKANLLNIEPTEENLNLVYNGQKGPWIFHHHRNWRMIEDGETSAALTFVDKGEGIAQCNLMSNGRIDLKSMPTLDSYKNELQKGLGDQFGQFVDSSEYTDEQNRQIMSVVVDGQYDDVPFRRIYYLITDKQGYQVTVMYDIAADKLDRFGDSGREIVETLEIIPPPETVKEEEKKPADEKAETKGTENEPAGENAETQAEEKPAGGETEAEKTVSENAEAEKAAEEEPPAETPDEAVQEKAPKE